MSKELTVFQLMTASTEHLIKVVYNEIGTKCCQPFAVRAFDALNELVIKNESEAKKAANIFLDNLQTLTQGGITSEDYDKLDLIKRGNVVTISARVQALLRACKRKGFMLIPTIIAVPKGDDVYFEEVYKETSGIIYLLRDARVNPDREITASRLVEKYFDRFICRLEIRDLKTKETIMTVTEMTNQEVMYAQSASENGIFMSEWKEVLDAKGQVVYADKAKTRPKRIKVVYDGVNHKEQKLNKESIWYKWTAEMVRKTVLRRALKNIKEVLPELNDTIMAFDTDIHVNPADEEPIEEIIIPVDGITNTDVNLHKLTEDQERDVEELFEIYKQNPANAMQDAEKIKEVYESGKSINEIINEYYAELVNLSKSKKTYPLIKNIIEGVPYEENKD